MADGKVVISTELDNSKIPKGINDVKGSLGGLNSVVKKLGVTITAAFSVAAIARFAKESVEASMQLSNALQGLQSIIEGQGRSFSDAQKFIEEYTSDGLIPATNAITAYKNLAARGYDDSQIRQVMVALKDASAFGRQASYTMGEAVQSATEGLKNENSILVDNAGVTKNVAKMWEEYAKSIGTTSANLTQQQKIQAEVNGILEESKYQAGDAEKVAGTLSGRLSQLSFNFEQLKVAVGDAIAPIVEAVLPTINAAITKLTEFANAFAAMIRTLTGTTATADDLANNFNNAADGAENLAGAITEAGKAAKKSLAPFDEISKLSGKDSSAAAGGGIVSGGVSAGTIAVGGDVQDNLSPKLQGVFTAVVEKVKDYLVPLQEIEFGNLITAFGDVQDALEPFGTMLFDGLEWAYNEILVPLAEWTIEDLLPSFLSAVSGAMRVMNSVITVLKPLAKWLWDSFLKPIAKWTGGIIVDVLEAIADGLTSVSDWVLDHQALIEGLIIVIGSFALAWELVNGALTAWNAIVLVWNNLGVISTAVTTAFGAAVNFLTSPITLVTLAIGALIAVIVLLVKNWDTVKETAKNVWDGIKSVWNTVANWFKEHVTDPIGKFFKNMVNGVIGFINGMISAVVSGINFIIRALNSLSFDVPDWVPGIGGQTWGFNISEVKPPQIPYLAKGAVLPPNKPFMAVVGDQTHGTNVEAPLTTIQEAVAIVMEDMIRSNIAGHEATVAVLREILEAVLGIHIGDDVIGQAVARHNAKMAIIRGGA